MSECEVIYNELLESCQQILCCLTWVLPPELSCTADLESAVLAANDLKLAPNMLLTPNAMSSFDETVRGYCHLPLW